MSNPEHEFARKIVRVLDQSARDMNGNTVAQLAAARKHALAGFRATPAWVPAWAGPLMSRITERPAVQRLLPMAILILALMSIVYWQAGNGGNGSSNELADLDARLLTDDLPIDAYLDKGFDSWLKRQSR
ncbi:MAG: DUF3619 family protein [Burkholderiales bacterium]|nr:DUF3619 family protein [Burkholderiales bacterium]